MDRIITTSELRRADDKELCALFNKVSAHLYRCEPGSPEAGKTLASLENIRREIGYRAARPKPPGF